jgi:putative PEP-CTERM system histidine kinase
MLYAVSYGIGACAFLALISLMLVNRRPRGFGFNIFLACSATTIWTLAGAAQTWWMPGVAHLLESVSSAAWLLLLASILSASRHQDNGASLIAWLPLAAGVIGLISIANDCRYVLLTAGPAVFTASQIFDRIFVSVCGILLVENIYRNASPGRRWNVIPMCIAIGAMFAYDLFVFCEAVVLRGLSPTLLAGRGVVLALIVPLLVLTMARNPGWNVDVHVSRRVVFHGATLTAAGVFLLVAAGVAGLIGRFPGQWASISEVAFFCGSVVVLLTVLSTESIRSRAKRIIAENFFSTRYDYRAEWLRSIATLSSAGAHERLSVRVIRAIADVVDSPGGALWLADSSGDYRIVQLLSMRLDTATTESASGEFIAGFKGGRAVQDLTRQVASAALRRPPWADSAIVWLAVPLMKIDRLIGFVVVAQPRAPASLNWESCDLLLAIGQQVAGYLEEERATRTLLESKSLIEYSRRFSFVIHDIKNVSGQLGMMIANIQKFGEREEFRADMIRGLESAAKKLGGLVDRLRPDGTRADMLEIVDVGQTIANLVRQFDCKEHPVQSRVGEGEARVLIVPTDLHAILTHLVTNAIEASAVGDEVQVELKTDIGKVVVEVTDKGCGMSGEFVRNELFVPLRSTKARGHGMGAFQARDLARTAGGDVEVVSAAGRGTTMRVVLPRAGQTDSADDLSVVAAS